jgi:hypothetical protein
VSGDSITGVLVESEDGDETITCDFAIDASGRSGASLSWLEAAGFGPAEETALEIGAGYASAVFKKLAGWHSSLDCLSIRGADPDTRGGFAFSVENDCWFVSLMSDGQAKARLGYAGLLPALLPRSGLISEFARCIAARGFWVGPRSRTLGCGGKDAP